MLEHKHFPLDYGFQYFSCFYAFTTIVSVSNLPHLDNLLQGSEVLEAIESFIYFRSITNPEGLVSNEILPRILSAW